MFCNQCGKEVSDNSNYCKYCGNKLSSDIEINAIVEKVQYIDCGHCKGTGTCRRGNGYYSNSSCNSCLKSAKVYLARSYDYEQTVICSVCKGTGKVLIENLIK